MENLNKGGVNVSKVIVLDAGHGGLDSGAVNGKYREAEANLGITLKLGDKLKSKGYKVIYTRENNKALTLQQRCNIANKNKADIFVSIHCNSATNKNAEGIETYKYPNIGGITKRLAQNIQNELIKNFPDEKNRGLKESKFYVLKHTKMPAALVEVGFISHNETAKKLYSYSYQNKLASAICHAIMKTLEA